MVRRVVVVVCVAAVLVAALVWSQYRVQPLKVSGFIDADEIRLGSRVGGRVAKVLVDEGDDVTASQPLVELEPFDLAERLAEARATLAARDADLGMFEAGYREEDRAQAKARLDQLAARLDMLEAGPRKQEIEAAQARRRLAAAELELAQQDFTRTSTLFERNAVNREQLDDVTTRLKVAQESQRVREEELAQLLEGTREEEIRQARAAKDEAAAALRLSENGYRKEEIDRARAARDAAAAAVRVIEAQLGELTINAPVDGSIEAIELEPGDLVAPNAPVISLVDARSLWVRAYVPENRLSFQLGQAMPVTVDSFPGEEFAGRVTYIARQAEFTPGNVQTPEERSKQVFRIKVTLESGLDRLRPGMIADIWLDRLPKATQ